MLNIMVFAPHPDDDIIACGGSMAKHLRQGNQVQVVYLTSGEAGSHKYSKEELAVIRKEEARRATASLGIKQISFLGMPDGYISYTRENLLTLVNIIRSERPSLIYVPRPGSSEGSSLYLATGNRSLYQGGWTLVSGLPNPTLVYLQHIGLRSLDSAAAAFIYRRYHFLYE